jgi:DNA-directed RNA polymerase subunit RPC12/RpoP
MARTKTHYAPTATAVETKSAACGRTARATENVHAVTCHACKARPEYAAAVTAAGVRAAEAFANQTPRTVRNPWNNEEIACRKCGGNLFRDNGRSLDRFNHVCAACGETTHTMTETGMSA